MDSKWSNPFLVVSFLALGAAIDGEAVGCRVVEITPGQEWDIVPVVNAGTPPFSRAMFEATTYGGSAPNAPTFARAISPVTYSAPGDQGPALRLTSFVAGVPAPLPSGTVVQVRASRCSA